MRVGANDGLFTSICRLIVGSKEGCVEGDFVSPSFVGLKLGDTEGLIVGQREGSHVGESVSPSKVGLNVGSNVSTFVGEIV